MNQSAQIEAVPSFWDKPEKRKISGIVPLEIERMLYGVSQYPVHGFVYIFGVAKSITCPADAPVPATVMCVEAAVQPGLVVTPNRPKRSPVEITGWSNPTNVAPFDRVHTS